VSFFVLYLLSEGLVVIAKSSPKPRVLNPDVELSYPMCIGDFVPAKNH